MRLTDFLASVGRDYALQQQFWQSSGPKLVHDAHFQRILGHHGWDDLDPDHRGFLEESDLAKIQEVLAEEAKQEGGGSSDVMAHQHAGVGIGPCWVLVRA